jgi:uncharacterized membrane protein
MYRAPEVLQSLLQSLHDSGVATAIREGESLFPWIECIHVLALTLVIGSIAIVDLRLIGMTSRDRSVVQTTALALPVTWSAFVVAAITGGLLFSSNAMVYAHNGFFQAKIALLAVAGLNMLAYQLLLGKGAAGWLTPAQTPWRARLAGGLSLGLWIAIAACGRWIGFTISTPG